MDENIKRSQVAAARKYVRLAKNSGKPIPEDIQRMAKTKLPKKEINRCESYSRA